MTTESASDEPINACVDATDRDASVVLNNVNAMLLFLHMTRPLKGVDEGDEAFTYGRSLVESTILDALGYTEQLVKAQRQ